MIRFTTNTLIVSPTDNFTPSYRTSIEIGIIHTDGSSIVHSNIQLLHNSHMTAGYPAQHLMTVGYDLSDLSDLAVVWKHCKLSPIRNTMD